MKKKDETLKWFKDEISRIKNHAARDTYMVDGKLVSRMDTVSLKQIELLEKQMQEYLNEQQ
jgi:hypothetical protein